MTLQTLAAFPHWVAWQEEDRPDGKDTTKVPYNPKRPGTVKALADNPKSWGTRAEAVAKAVELPKKYQMGGVGIEFTSLDDGRRTGGIDLDTCRDPATGVVEPWAQSVIERFNCYTEISPSHTGVKLFFLYAAADEMELRKALGTNAKGELKYSTAWTRKTGNKHPPALELHLGHRFFTITDNILPGCTDELRAVSTADLLRLIRVEGPAFVGNVESPPPRAGKSKNSATQLPLAAERKSPGTDHSRSAAAFRVAAASRRRGVTYESMCEELRTHELTAEWFTDKGQANGGRELLRLWDKTDLASGDLILSPSAPLPSARTYVAREHTDDGQRTLHHQNATFYEWRRSHYAERSGEEMRGRLYRFLEKAKRYDDDGFLVAFDPNKNRVANVQEALAAATQLSSDTRPPAWLDGRTDPAAGDMIACTNGLLHLPSMALHPLTPAFLSLNALDFAYNPKAGTATAWLAFLSTVWPDDQESINTLQELFGLLLTADTRYQKAFLIVGPKRSGKGTIARVMTQLLGIPNVCSPTLSSLGSNFGLQPLIGKRLAIISDARLSGKVDQAVITERLLSVTGEDGMTIDRKNRAHWTGKLDARFVVLTNELPKLSDSSGALASRFVILRMVQSFFGREDMGLSEKLAKEMPGILLWAIQGWKRLTERKHFVTPASAKAAQEELENLGSPIGAFLRARCVIGSGQSVRTDLLYREWCDWCHGQGRDHAGTVQIFGRDLGAAVAGLKVVQHRDGEERLRYYEGVTLLPAGQQAPDDNVTRVGTRSTPIQPQLYADPSDPGPIDRYA